MPTVKSKNLKSYNKQNDSMIKKLIYKNENNY